MKSWSKTATPSKHDDLKCDHGIIMPGFDNGDGMNNITG